MVRLLGTGAMGAVYEAHQLSLDRRVAFKILMLREEVKWDVLRQRFIQEARLAARVNHQNIVQIFDVGEEKGVAYIVMEYAEAVTLKDLLEKQPCFPVTRLYRLAVKVARGLAAAHQENVVHRDIKPDNILVTSRGEIKIADFGAASLAVGDDPKQCLIGTPAFMAPEVIRRESSDGRADVYALGLILYKAAAAAHPFVEKNVRAVLKAHLHKPLPGLKERRPALADEFVRLIEKMCSKLPHERYDSVTLVDILEHHPTWEVAVGPEEEKEEPRSSGQIFSAGYGSITPSPSEFSGPGSTTAKTTAVQTTCAFHENGEIRETLEDCKGETDAAPDAGSTAPKSMTRDIRDISPVQERRVGQGRRRPPKREVDPELQQLCIAARFQILKKNWSRAEETYRRILERDARNDTAIVGLARLCAARGREEEAISWLRQALENGLVQSDTVQNSKEFEALREHRDFCELVAEYSI